MRLFRFAFVAAMALLSVSSLRAQSPKGADIEFQTNIVDLGELSHDDDKHIPIREISRWWSPRCAQAVRVLRCSMTVRGLCLASEAL